MLGEFKEEDLDNIARGVTVVTTGARVAWNAMKAANAKVVPTGPSFERPTARDARVGFANRQFSCTMQRGKPRRKLMNVKKISNALIIKNTELFQSLNWSHGGAIAYKNGGKFPLVMEYITGGATPGEVPRHALFPVYVFRLNCPSGVGDGGYIPATTAFAASPINVSLRQAPVIAYRLNGYQNAVTDPWRYTWEPVEKYGTNVAIGSNCPASYLYASGTSTAANCNGIVVGEGVFKDTEHCHVQSDCQVLFTGSKTNSVDVCCCIVRFTDDQFAPPDEALYLGDAYTNEQGRVLNPYDRIRYHENAGDLEPGVVRDYDDAEEDTFEAILGPWLTSKIMHPCYAYTSVPGVIHRKAWHESQKFQTSISSTLTNFSDTAATQYKHRLITRPGRWMNMNTDPLDKAVYPNPGSAFVVPVDTNKHCGLFPKRAAQQWLMVSGFDRSSPKSGAWTFSSNTDASFDISIKSVFASARTDTLT